MNAWRSLAWLQTRRLALTVLALSLLGTATSAHAASASPRIIGGSPATIQQVPWQVAVLASNPPSVCGGAIVDATHVLTAAHCVVPTGTSAPRAPGDVTVLAGANDYTAYVPGQPPPPGSQVVTAAALRVHPMYAEQPQASDDVAVITVNGALDLSTPNAKAISLGTAGPAPGTLLGVSGYGQQDQSRPPSGQLYAATLTTISDDDCRVYLENTSPVVQCAQSSSAATCHGDSGSALTTTGGTPVLVGVLSFGPHVCGQGPSGFADVTAPEVRAFLDGAAAIPVAPRLSRFAVLNTLPNPVNGSPMFCDPGTWTGAPSVGYSFQTDTVPAQILQTGPSNAYTPSRGDVGKAIVCVVAAANAGGVASARTGTAAPIALDTVPPRFAVTYLRCARRRCRVVLRASDPNSRGRLQIRVSAQYRATVRCRKHGHRSRCRRTLTRAFAVKQVKQTTFRATGARLPYRRLRIAVRVADAAGNRARTRRARATMRRAR